MSPLQERERAVAVADRAVPDGRPSARRTPMPPAPPRLELARAAYGLAQLVVPDRMAGEALTPRVRLVVRVLGARHLLQAALTWAAVSGGHSRRPHDVGGAVDLLHAGTMVGLSLTRSPVRRLAAVDAMCAGTWSLAELLTADRLRGTDRRRPSPDARPARPGTGSPSGSSGADRGDDERGDGDAEVNGDGSGSRRRVAAAALQEVVRDLASGSEGRPVAEVLGALREAMTARGLSPQPEPWLQAAARDAASGHVYIVDKQAARDVGIDLPLPGPPTTGVT